MFGHQRIMLFCFCLVSLLVASLALEESTDIEEDVISIANQTQKVIRVHPHDLPPKKDSTGSQMNSAFFQIQTLRPGSSYGAGSAPESVTDNGKRQYLDSKQMRKRRPRPPVKAVDQKLKQQKQLNLDAKGDGVQVRLSLDGNQAESRSVPVQMTPGPYPIYYVLSRSNGRFGKFPVKAFRSPAEFSKYLVKSKAEPIGRDQRFELIGAR
ncbi:uncharacterized protein LOC110178498 isoform X2 [Drosophila serrata]|uniref:uncharacterized protein LOC110178498 isoform X2 n=1 Tax=Drosophila serrata TaxID=7274 RepID=UPI000A1D0072|nr:uncharacterized protein LOC110178498 isoform X2 [Drosophila serrata]